MEERARRELLEYFEKDAFAAGAGIRVLAVSPEEASCTLALEPRHCNALGHPQGGLVYTLADFAFALAANAHSRGAVTLNSTIHYLRPARGAALTATARLKSATRRFCVYEVEVVDGEARAIALATITGALPPPGQG